VAGYVIQTGDPNGDCTGGYEENGIERTIPLETHPDLEHIKGSVGMARGEDPDSASSQFYIALNKSSTSKLDGKYAVFGKVSKGMDIVMNLREGDIMTRVCIK